MYYEIHDPARYLTPDVTADFSDVAIEEVGPDRVRLERRARRAARPDDLKVLVGVDHGLAGSSARCRTAVRAASSARGAPRRSCALRLESMGADIDDLRIDLQGVDSLFGDRMPGGYPAEVRLRLASAHRRRGDSPGRRCTRSSTSSSARPAAVAW